jgi:Glucose / Sorbosone dehydrogenase
VVEQAGRIRYLLGRRLGGTFLDIRSRVVSGGERGLLSVAFSPRYAQDQRFYINYTDRNGDTRVVEFRSRPGHAVLSTARGLLFVAQGSAADLRKETAKVGQLSSFGEDAAGSIYISSGSGRIYQLVR